MSKNYIATAKFIHPENGFENSVQQGFVQNCGISVSSQGTLCWTFVD